MIHLEMTTATSNIRAYHEAGGYENRQQYHAFLTVTHLTDTHVYLHGAIGVVDRETREKAFEMLRARGITKVQMERHGQMRTIDL